MIAQILVNAPLWAWTLLAVLTVIGAMQLRNRKVGRIRVLILPAIMLPFSLSGIVGSFSGNALAVGLWLAGVVAAIAINETVLRSPGGVRYLPAEEQFELRGSAVPLTLIMLAFWSRFALNVANVMTPAAVADLALPLSAGFGVLSGSFGARAWRILQAAREPLAKAAEQAAKR